MSTPRIGPKIGRVLFWSLCLLVGLISLRILLLGFEVGFPDMRHQLPREAVFWAHVLAASGALLILPFQFWAALRNRYRHLHRWMGRSYGIFVLIGGVSGAILAPFADTGAAAASGFFLLALAWLFTTFNAIRFARRGDFSAHKRWMIRSGALTFAAVTLRLYLPFSFLPGVSYDIAYPIIAWACWVPNLLLAELWIARKNRATTTA